MKSSLLVLFIVMVISFFSFDWNREVVYSPIPETKVASLLVELGENKGSHFIDKVDPEKAKIGLELIQKGYSKKGFGRSKIISPYFVCTDCHSMGRESEDSKSNLPEDRLDFAIKKKKPFYPASTFWGIYNRTSWYNGDYTKKYGEIITKARESLKESIQVCAKYCSAGRFLEDWEAEAILHYFKSEELELKDIQLTQRATELLDSDYKTPALKSELLQELKKSFPQKEEATFLTPMEVEKRQFGKNGDAKKGKEIFNRSCMHCHFQGRVSHLKLDNDILTAKWFQKNLKEYTDESIYQIVRYGTYTRAGRNQYMPLYTKEKMSDQQIEDLVAYIQQLAKTNP